MPRFADQPEVEVATHIAAPPSAVWPFVVDIDLPARFQDEFRGADWIDAGPALGARFSGRNQRGDRSWETTSWVVAYEPERTFGWAVSDPEQPGATWTFHLEPEGDGTRLRFHRRLGPGPSGITRLIERHPERQEEIIVTRNATHLDHMEAVVEGIRQLVEV